MRCVCWRAHQRFDSCTMCPVLAAAPTESSPTLFPLTSTTWPPLPPGALHFGSAYKHATCICSVPPSEGTGDLFGAANIALDQPTVRVEQMHVASLYSRPK